MEYIISLELAFLKIIDITISHMQKFLLNSKLWVKLVEHIGCFLTPPPFPLNISALQLILPVFCLLHKIGEMESSFSTTLSRGKPNNLQTRKTHTHKKRRKCEKSADFYDRVGLGFDTFSQKELCALQRVNLTYQPFTIQTTSLPHTQRS